MSLLPLQLDFPGFALTTRLGSAWVSKIVLPFNSETGELLLKGKAQYS